MRSVLFDHTITGNSLCLSSSSSSSNNLHKPSLMIWYAEYLSVLHLHSFIETDPHTGDKNAWASISTFVAILLRLSKIINQSVPQLSCLLNVIITLNMW